MDPETGVKPGKRVKLKSLADLDRRTAAAKSAFDLRDRIISDLGGADRLSAMQCELIDSVALLGAAIKDMGASYLSGRPVDLAECATLMNAQRRLLADLGLDRKTRDITPDLSDYVNQRTAGEVTAPS